MSNCLGETLDAKGVPGVRGDGRQPRKSKFLMENGLSCTPVHNPRDITATGCRR